MPRVNLITNPSFKTDTTGWYATGSSTIARVTTDAFYGGSCLQITKAAAADSGTALLSFAVVAGSTYTASAYVKVPSGQEDSELTVYVEWRSPTGTTLISTSVSTPTGLTDLDGWVRLAVTATAPVGTGLAVFGARQPTAGTAGQVFLLDAVLFEQATFAGQYLDELTQGVENSTMDLALKRVPVPHLTGAELNADIALGNLVFNTVDEYGVAWVITQVEGWWNLPTPNMPSIDRGFADGTYDVRGRFESRAITLTGVILPPDRSKLPAARERLLSAANLVYQGAWLRLDEGPVKACWVRLIAQPTVDTVNPRGRTEFSLQLRAADPVKYEYAPNDPDGKRVTALTANNKLTVTEARANVTNSGNTDVTAVFQVVGPLYGPNASIENLTTGQAMTVVGSLRPARSFTVTKRATDLDGVSTVTLDAARHNVRAGDEVLVASTAAGYNGTWTVSAIAANSVSYYTGLAFEAEVTGLTGTLVAEADVLEIDTYDREVALNGLVEGSRSQLDTLTDWTYLRPALNEVAYYDDNQSPTFIKSYSRGSGTTTITTLGDHDFYPFDSVYVASPAAIATSTSTVKAATTSTAAILYIPDAGGTVATTNLGPVVYTDTRAQAIGAVAWNNTSKAVTLQTEFDHGMVIGDYLTVDGGNVSPVGGLNIGVSTGTPVAINTYAFNTTTDVLTVVPASNTGYVLGDEIEVYNLGGDFDGVFTIASISGSSPFTITANVVSTTATFTSTSAPSEAALRRVYRVAAPVTNNTLTYVKRGPNVTTFTTTAVTPMAGKVYQLGTGTATVAYRSGWIS